jgi:hypothetical protein
MAMFVHTYRGADKSLARPTSRSIVFSVQGTGGSLTGPDPENRVGDQVIGSLERPVSSGLQVPGEPFLPGRAKDLTTPLYINIVCHELVMELAAVLYCCTYNKTSVLCGTGVESAEDICGLFKIYSICHIEVMSCEVRLCVTP